MNKENRISSQQAILSKVSPVGRQDVQENPMAPYKIRLIYGLCGNLRLIVAEHLEELFAQAGFQYKMAHQSV
jgi:hypothetical protein